MRNTILLYFLILIYTSHLFSQPSDLLWHLPGNDSMHVRALGAPGDLNLDGYDDVMILRTKANNSTPSYLELYFGGNPMDTTPDFIYY